MQVMRYINLFERISGINTTTCFVYNGTIIFAVSHSQISKAIGKNAINVKKIAEILRRKIKVIGIGKGKEKKDIENFVKQTVEPVQFTNFELKDGEAIINATMQNKAVLIGRNACRQQELEDILKRFYDINKVRII